MVFYCVFGTVALPIFIKKLDVDSFYHESGTCARPTLYEKLDVDGFTMNLAYLLVHFSITSRRQPKAVQGAKSDLTGTPGRPKGP